MVARARPPIEAHQPPVTTYSHGMVAMKTAKNLLRAAFSRAEYVSVGLAAGYRLASRLGARYRIPVLVYHKVTADFDSAAKLSCAVTLSAFESHIACIHDLGFKPISMEQYSRCVSEQEPFGDAHPAVGHDQREVPPVEPARHSPAGRRTLRRDAVLSGTWRAVWARSLAHASSFDRDGSLDGTQASS